MGLPVGGVEGEDVDGGLDTGNAVGDDETGCFDGELLGLFDGLAVGELDIGNAVGLLDGLTVGDRDVGNAVGLLDGLTVGERDVGNAVGLIDGLAVGDSKEMVL